MRGVLADTGPLVALLNRNDDLHAECAREFRRMREPMLTVLPVITEAMHLLQGSWTARDALWELFATGAASLVPVGEADFARMRELMRKYRDQDMDVADAALVRVAEREGLTVIFTLDRDFAVYRIGAAGRFTLRPG